MTINRHCWWQMEDQEVWPLGKPREHHYYGRCAHPKVGVSEPCFWPENLACQKDGCKKWVDIKQFVKTL